VIEQWDEARRVVADAAGLGVVRRTGDDREAVRVFVDACCLCVAVATAR
jgi:hypothetical protein